MPITELPPAGKMYRCDVCGNKTRFDVVITRRVKEFFHQTLGGDSNVDDSEVLEERVNRVNCRICGSSNVEIIEGPGNGSS